MSRLSFAQSTMRLANRPPIASSYAAARSSRGERPPLLYWASNCIVLAGCLTLTCMVGCSGQRDPRLEDYLDELEFSAPVESIEYVTLGEFVIPIAVPREAAASDVPARWKQIRFELSVETLPEFHSELSATAEKRDGVIRDAVLTVCRSISLDELSDPRLAALKSRLAEQLGPLLGGRRIRQLVLRNYVDDRM